MALKRFTAPSLDSQAIALLPSKNPIISYVEYPNGRTSANSAGGETIIIHGYNFRPGINVYLDTNRVNTVTRVNGTTLRFITDELHLSSASRDLYVVNSDGTSALYPPRFQITSEVPTWITAAGSLGQVDEFIYSFTVKALSDSTVRYSVVSGQLPVGYALRADTGVISGSHNIPAQNTIIYSFTIRATDLESQSYDRSFSITFVPTYPTWVTLTALPSGRVGVYYTTSIIAVSNTVLTYQKVGDFPPGLSLNQLSGIISGTPTVAVNTTLIVNAIDNENNTTQKIFSIVIV